MDVALRRRQLIIDGEPRLMLAGEIHYFRVPRVCWGQRLDLLVEAGANTLATYVPWVVHERADGTIDLAGRTRPELDLGAFVDLAAERGLQALIRPGPFTMGELRHEGIPTRLRTQYPQLVPVGWDGVPATTSTLDYLHPDFLREVGRWYEALGAVLTPRMAGCGGPITGVQLDNEIGMLAWVSNSPDLTDLVITELVGWLGDTGRLGRYPAPAQQDWTTAIRSPDPSWAAALRTDLALFMRERFRTYVAELSSMATAAGFGTVPLYVNVHGTEARGALNLTIGTSQLLRTWQDVPGLTAGSDHYLGTLDVRSAAELHLVHAFLDATLGDDQPLTSLEFEAGTGDYGDALSDLTDPSAVVLKTRLLLAQGCRGFNWYLFAGGQNELDPASDDDGTHRFGITGQRHGAAAPVTPEGERGLAFASTAESMQLARGLEEVAATWLPETDDLAVGFVPDHWATEYAYPDSVMTDLRAELERYRGAGPLGLVPRLLLAGGFRYGAVDLQRDPESDRPWPTVIVLGTGRVLDEAVQRRLLEHVERGGGLLLHGDLPVIDAEARSCTVLADALGWSAVRRITGGPHRFPSVVGAGVLADLPELRVGQATVLSVPETQVLMQTAVEGEPCAATTSYGRGRVALLANEAALSAVVYARLLAGLGVRPRLTHEVDGPGLVVATTRTADSRRFVHLINTEGWSLTVRLWFDGDPLFGGNAVVLAPRTGQILQADSLDGLGP